VSVFAPCTGKNGQKCCRKASLLYNGVRGQSIRLIDTIKGRRTELWYIRLALQ